MSLWFPFLCQPVIAKANKYKVWFVKTHDPDIQFMYSESICYHAWSDMHDTVASPSAELGSFLKDGNINYGLIMLMLL